MKWAFLTTFVLIFSILGCASGSVAPTPDTGSDPSVTPTPSNPPLSIRLHSIGISETNDGLLDDLNTYDEVRVFVRAVSGNEEIKFAIPPEAADPFNITPAQQTNIERSLFGTESVAGTVLLEIVAVEIDNPAESQLLFNLLLGADVGLLDALQASQSTDRTSTVIGSYQGIWTKADNWGAGSYEAVGEGDLRLWFDVAVDGLHDGNIVGRPFPTPTPTPTPTATPTPLPTVTSLVWLDAQTGHPIEQITSGASVILAVTTNAKEGTQLEVAMYEVDESLDFFHAYMGEISLTVRDGVAAAAWEPEWFYDFDDDSDPEYRFQVFGRQSTLLKVVQ